MNALAARHEPELTSEDFDRIAAILRARAGISLPGTKQQLVYSRLARRLRVLRLPSFGAYVRLVESDGGAEELVEMISALTTNVTAFFRERHHFDLLRTQVLPPLVAAARAGGRVRLWSAGCSSGMEPYSMAITLLELFPEAARHDVRILATDIDPAILAEARAGTYPSEALEPVGAALVDRYFRKCGPDSFRVEPALRDLISFRELNLAIDWPVKGPFDVIFCRNVAIYFDRAVQERVWDGFARRLAPGGLLCIGHSERVSGPAEKILSNAGITAYRRRA